MNALQAIALGASSGLALRFWYQRWCVQGYAKVLMFRLQQEVDKKAEESALRSQQDAKEKAEIQTYVDRIYRRMYVYKTLGVNYLREHGGHVSLAPWQTVIDDDIHHIRAAINPVTQMRDFYLDEGTVKPQ